jgi:signal transduction histidine kinase
VSGRETKQLNVLLVEDNDTHAHVVRRYIDKATLANATLVHVERLSTALERMAKGGIDALLLDLSLPDSRITETLSRVIEAYPEMPVVILTSLNDLDFATAAVQQGAQDFLVKSELSSELLIRSILYAIERKKTQDKLEAYAAELERSNEHLRGFAHTVAHEVKSPLNVVSACLQWMQAKYAAQFDSESGELLADSAAAIRGMTELVNELLEFGSAEVGEHDFVEVDLEAVFYQAYVLLRPEMKRARATLTHDPLPVVRGNEIQIRQLLQNLIGNAIKYRREASPEIHVSSSEANGELLLSVRDNGLGISISDLERVFDAFVRVHRSINLPGSGIGLAFCKRVVENHNGRIWVESELGCGSTFFVALPTS